jgi:signal transduction histidine kinase
MSTAAHSIEQLREEAAGLRARLDEANETLRAIQIGEVDAVLVHGSKGEQLYTLKGADEPYRVLIEEMNQGAVTLSAKGLILYCNRRFADLLKTPIEEIVGLDFSAFVALSEQAGFAALLEAARMEGSAAEITLCAGDLSEVPLQLALSPLPAEFAAAICLVATDISESRKREKAKDIRSEGEIRELNAGLEQRVIERTAQLEVAVKEIASFSYSVSHDLRAPIRAMDGYSRIMLEDYGEKVDEEGRRVLKIIRSEAKRMGDLVDDLLAFSRLSREPMVASEVDMTALAKSVFESLAALERDRELQLALRPLPVIKGELAMLRQVWVNLLSNAIKFTKGREVAQIEIGAETTDAEQIYYVKDNGAGFDMRFVGKLFAVFQRLHTEQEFPGTGVGLAIVQRVIARHGGRVWAEGKTNEGATIYFAIPKTKR